MQSKTAEVRGAAQTSRRSERPRGALGNGLTFVGAVIVGLGALATAELDYLAPKSPQRAEGVAERLSRYAQRGQLRADFHTLIEVGRYLVASDSVPPGPTGPTNTGGSPAISAQVEPPAAHPPGARAPG